VSACGDEIKIKKDGRDLEGWIIWPRVSAGSVTSRFHTRLSKHGHYSVKAYDSYGSYGTGDRTIEGTLERSIVLECPNKPFAFTKVE